MAAATKRGAITIIGGGDSVSAVKAAGCSHEDYTHISTGGGASLELIEGNKMPGRHSCIPDNRTQCVRTMTRHLYCHKQATIACRVGKSSPCAKQAECPLLKTGAATGLRALTLGVS